MKVKLTFLISIVWCFFYIKVYSADIIGGSLRYESLGNQKYKIIGIVNRDCSGGSLATPYFSVFSDSLHIYINATRVSIKDITNYCKGKSTPCSPQNTQNGDGQEQHVFESIVDFSIAPYAQFYSKNNCEVKFSMEVCCRSNKITTMSTAGTFYLDAMLNLCNLGKNEENSTSTVVPDTYIEMCLNSPFTYNFGYYEKDLDSLLHTLETPIRGIGFEEKYNGSLSANFPMTPLCFPPGSNCKPLTNAKPPRGIYFSSNTGDFIVTPTSGGEKALMKIKTSEYRLIGGLIKNIGYSTVEVFVKIINCLDDNPPTITGNSSYNVCEGDKLCFTIQSRDTRTIIATVDDTTYMTWNKGIPGTNCTWKINDSSAREKSAQFCWQTQIGDS
ncbi:MAG: hypothetical protein PSX81_05705 [bacterium]|nr:hypothetical protein [bacterium]